MLQFVTHIHRTSKLPEVVITEDNQSLITEDNQSLVSEDNQEESLVSGVAQGTEEIEDSTMTLKKEEEEHPG